MYDYYDSPYSWLWMLSRGYLSVVLFYGGFLFYVFPLLQALVQQQNKRWLSSTLGRVKNLDPSVRDSILLEAEPEFKEPLYKLTKFQYLVGGIITSIAGILIAILGDADEDILKALVWLPLLVGGAVIAIYFKLFPNVRLWKETAGFFGVLGIILTIPGIFAVYEWDWMRSDILVYIVLVLSLAVVHVLESTVASLMYIVAVAVGSMFLTVNTSHNWMTFFKAFIWLFALAPLVFWMPKLKSNKESGVKEIAFGILFMVMMIIVTLSNLDQLRFLGLAIMLPILYMFSKVHFKQDGWFLTKPIQTLIVLLTFIGIATFSIEGTLNIFPSFKSQFINNFGFYWLVDLLIVVAMGFGAVMLYRDNFEEDLKKINLVVLCFPLAAYLLSYTADFYGHYLFLAMMGAYGWTYLRTGLDDKNVFSIMLGAMGVITLIPLIYAQLPNDLLQKRVVVGFLVLVYGAAMIFLSVYMRKEWSVTDDNDEIATPVPAPIQPTNTSSAAEENNDTEV
ncbi:MAG: hypothetical protein H6598_02960 [Flavobacteriales bacterium]|nr:hypothetical protein [Flavobacteriales bacterium]